MPKTKTKAPKNKKKIKRRNKKSILDMDQFYTLVNFIQINASDLLKKTSGTTFLISFLDTNVVENVMKDLGFTFSKKIKKKAVKYTVFPSKQVKISPLLDDLDMMEDEIPEEGQISFD